jgi:glycosyltransferase involved in cell wall biosynthesis
MDDDPLRWPEHQQSDFLTFRCCHGVQVSTEALAEFMRPLNPNVAVFPNQLAYLPSPRIYEEEREPVLFFGALNREADWLPVMPGLNRLLRHCQNRVKVMVIHDRAFFDALETGNKEFTPFCTYEEYVSALRNTDIALLPLLPNHFNRMKSDLKFLECAGHGVAALASPTVYEVSITDGGTGMIYRTPEEFEMKLALLLEDRKLRRSITHSAYAWVGKNRLLGQHYKQRYLWYRELLSRLPELNAELEKRMPGIISRL